MKKFTIYGDSHSRYFEINKKLLFHAPWIGGYDIRVNKIPAASIIGLGKKRSKLNVAETIINSLDRDGFNVFAFGQVDLELGYYYKKFEKNEDVELEGFVSFLLHEYVNFIDQLDVESSNIGIKGLNLTVLKYQIFAFAYVKRIIAENISDEAEIIRVSEDLKNNMDGFSVRNNATLIFNSKLKFICQQKGWRYFDVNDYLSDFTPGKGIADRFIPAGFDHHVVDSLEVRKLHLKKMVDML